MAKTVKFNMRFGDSLIRTVEDLQDNFSMEDVIAHYENGLLKKFLERRGYADFAQKIEELPSKELADDSLARELVSIFHIDADKDTVDEYAEILRLRRENQAAYEAYAQGEMKAREAVEKYFADYDKLVNCLIENKNELGKIRAGVQELLDTYSRILEKDWRALYVRLEDSGALYPICHMLTKGFFRHRWLPEIAGTSAHFNERHPDTEPVYKQLVSAFKSEINNAQDDHPWLKKSNKADAAYWEDIVAAGKTYMILQVPNGAKVRAPGDIDNEMVPAALNDKFINLDGIQYRHNSKIDYLYFAEV